MGIMVWSEIPVYWTILWENPRHSKTLRTNCRHDCARQEQSGGDYLVDGQRDSCREARLAFLKKLIERARSLDSTNGAPSRRDHPS